MKSPFPLHAEGVKSAMKELVEAKDYPCIAALRSLKGNESPWGAYEGFGTGRSGPKLREALRGFMEEQARSGSDYLSYWAIFGGETPANEEHFEKALWDELSALTSAEQQASDWGDNPADPSEKDFSFCLFGEPFFVVGLHPLASRPGRAFGRPTLIFNVFRQFESLEAKGAYLPMVRTNRARDLKYSGSINPMSEKHGDEWEAIQFSGRNNPDAWKCPFHAAAMAKRGQTA